MLLSSIVYTGVFEKRLYLFNLDYFIIVPKFTSAAVLHVTLIKRALNIHKYEST